MLKGQSTRGGSQGGAGPRQDGIGLKYYSGWGENQGGYIARHGRVVSAIQWVIQWEFR